MKGAFGVDSGLLGGYCLALNGSESFSCGCGLLELFNPTA